LEGVVEVDLNDHLDEGINIEGDAKGGALEEQLDQVVVVEVDDRVPNEVIVDSRRHGKVVLLQLLMQRYQYGLILVIEERGELCEEF